MYSGTLLEFLNMGGGEIALIMLVVLLLFGGKKLPELARGLGKGIREFKDASEGVKREIHRNINAVDEEEAVVVKEEEKVIEEPKAEEPKAEEKDEFKMPVIEPAANTAPVQTLTPQPEEEAIKKDTETHV